MHSGCYTSTTQLKANKMLFNNEATTNPEILQGTPDKSVLRTLNSPFRKTVNETSVDVVYFSVPEFTCVCPVTRQPDFAELNIWYMPGQYIVESKSLKLYIHSFRNIGIFHEAAVRVIKEDLVNLLRPRWLRVTGEFNRRGGIASNVTSMAAAHASGDFNTAEQRVIEQMSDLDYLRFRAV